MGLFNRLNGPVAYKESSDLKDQLEKLKACHENASNLMKKQIELDMKILSNGIIGEENVRYELMNSFMPLIFLHDLYLEHEGLTAQIDFLVITRKLIFIIECKNLFGNIEVNSNGDFIRTMEYNGLKKREWIYSPITQNQRHLELLRQARRDVKTNVLSKLVFDKFFDDNYKSVVVLANPKTVINMKYAKKEVKQQIIRNDQLISYIKGLNMESRNAAFSDAQMYDFAETFLQMNKENKTDYTRKYMEQEIDKITIVNEVQIDLENMPIYKALKNYRFVTSKAEDIKAYYIYNNMQMEELIREMPGSIDELKLISGFGEVKCDKYGVDILKIIDQHRA